MTPAGPAVVSLRALNRATLARQLLLDRADVDERPVVDVVEHLVGMQAQTTHSWYVGLWNRIGGLAPEAVSTELEGRRLVRLALMRSTIHLVSARDALALRPVLAPMLARALNGSRHGRELEGVDRAALAAAGRAIVEAEPCTLTELGARLAPRFPGRDPGALAQGVRADEALVQVTPRGLWRRSGQARHTTLSSWLGEDFATELTDDLSVDALVRRYLNAFGPATVKDVQAWSGLTRLAEVLERMRPSLVVLRSPDGAELFDLPDAPRPDADVAAPVRLLYDFDNLLLSYADRSRVTTNLHQGMTSVANGVPPAAVLVDGFTAGTWRVRRARGTATLTAVPHTRFTKKDAGAVEAEAATLLEFTDADAKSREVRVLRAAP